MQRLKQRALAAARESVRRLGFDVVRYRERGAAALCGVAQLGCRTVIDVGANHGQFAQQARALFPTARIHCFEPVPSALRVLEPWAREDGNVQVHKMALGPDEGTTVFHVFEDYTPASSVLASAHTPGAATGPATALEVPVGRLDSVFGADGVALDGPALLKLDVQGYEAHVLRGGSHVLSAVDACVLEVCNDHLYDGQATFAELHALAQAAGLHFVGNSFQRFGDDGHVVYFDAVFRR